MLTLIADSNLFLECRPLEELPWDMLGAASVQIAVTRPVQTEIDRHKKNRSGRTYKKAIATFARFRSLITSGEAELIIREAQPRVTLVLMPVVRGDVAAFPALDPAHPDDAILLCLTGLEAAFPGADIRLLTHDTGPMATAKSLGLAFLPIPDEWLLDPQDDEAARAVKRLEAENRKLRQQEPMMAGGCLTDDGSPLRRFETERHVHPPLGAGDIETLVARIAERFPPITDFDRAGPPPRRILPKGLPDFAPPPQLEPASSEDIDAYRNTTYPAWIERCRDYLTGLHRILNARCPLAPLHFQFHNQGTRPAQGVLITFEMQGGGLQLYMPPKKKDVQAPTPAILPPPPAAPRTRWKVAGGQSGVAEMMARASRLGALGMFDGPRAAAFDRAIAMPMLAAAKTDPDSFYWKDGRPERPQADTALTCQNWRHGIAPEAFNFELAAPTEPERIEGRIVCRIHAENLSDPFEYSLPLVISNRPGDTHAAAERLIEALRDTENE